MPAYATQTYPIFYVHRSLHINSYKSIHFRMESEISEMGYSLSNGWQFENKRQAKFANEIGEVWAKVWIYN